MSITTGIGHQIWATAEGYIPQWSNGPEPQMESHETLCILNTSDIEAHITLHIYFSDQEPAGPYKITVPGRRTLHQRLNNLKRSAPCSTCKRLCLPSSIRCSSYRSAIEA